MTCSLLGAMYANVKPTTMAQARRLIGSRVEYLRNRDIDKSGRGYYFPQTGKVEEAAGRNFAVDGDWVSISEVSELRVIPVEGDQFDVWGDHYGRLKVEIARQATVSDSDGNPSGYPRHLIRVTAQDKAGALAAYRTEAKA